ncbi:MAG TPA: protein disulfide isomerase family protein [Pirellulales bacterium]|nr:protein disulfide isomerase family protein [Pirellulales bacterium]
MNVRPFPVLLRFAWAATLLVAGCEVRSGGDVGLIADLADSAAKPTVESSPDVPAGASVNRGGLQFVNGYHRGFELARDQHKPMLVFFTAEWCTYCHQMEAEAFTEEPVVKLAKQFVCILVDADCEPNVCHDFRVKGYPTIQFLSPRGVPLNRVTGKQPARKLVIQMQAALQAVARRNGAEEAIRR